MGDSIIHNNHDNVNTRVEKLEDKFSVEHEFAQTTTLHGPSRFADTNKPLWLRFLWTVAFASCLGVCAWQILLRFDCYLQYNSTTKVSILYEERLEFPAVTICNFNRYQRSKVDEYLERLEGNDTSLDEDYEMDEQWESFLLDLPFNGIPNNNLNLTDFTLKTGFQLDNRTMKECTWRGKRCTAANFTHVFTAYGNCYTFNSGKEPTKEILIEDHPGAGSGLHVLIDIQQDEYSESIVGNSEAGLKVLAHHQSEPPQMEALADALPPGFHAFVGIKKFEFRNLEPKWGKCDKSRSLKYHHNYTLGGCVLECKLDHYRERCKCKPVGYPGPDEVCNVTSLATCVEEVTGLLKAGALKPCNCPIPCHYITFGSRHSYAAYPNQAVAEDILLLYNISQEYLENNFVSLDVFYEELNYELAVEKEAMSYDALISDIGGQAGLFIGASFITFGEFIEYFLRRMNQIFCKSKRAKQSSSNSNADLIHTSTSLDIPLK